MKYIDCTMLIQRSYFFKIVCGVAVQISVTNKKIVTGIRFLGAGFNSRYPNINCNKNM